MSFEPRRGPAPEKTVRSGDGPGSGARTLSGGGDTPARPTARLLPNQAERENIPSDHRSPATDFMNLLIVKLSAIGDVVMSLPFLEALRRHMPDARITWLVEEAAADLVLDHPRLDRVIVSSRKTWTRHIKKGDFRSTFGRVSEFLRELRSGDFDLTVDLQGLFKSGILTGLSRAPRRLGFDRTRELSYLFLNQRLKPYDPDRHALLRYLDVAAFLGADVSSVDYSFPHHDQAAASAAEKLGPIRRPLVVINAGAKWETKLWPTDHWQALGHLLSRRGYQIVLTGSSGEKEVSRRIASGLAGALDLTGETRLKELAEVYRRADLVVCPDTGPMHLAAAVGTPVVALFGPTAPWRTGPFGPGHVIVRTGIECSPCFLKKCSHTRCMKEMTPEMVEREIVRKLKL